MFQSLGLDLCCCNRAYQKERIVSMLSFQTNIIFLNFNKDSNKINSIIILFIIKNQPKSEARLLNY